MILPIKEYCGIFIVAIKNEADPESHAAMWRNEWLLRYVLFCRLNFSVDCLLRMCPGSVSGNIQTLENVKCKLGRLPRTTSASGYCLYGILPSAQHTIMHSLTPAMQRFHHTATQLRVDIIIIFTGDTFTVSESSHLAVSVSLPAAVRCCLVRTQDRGHFLIFTTLDSHTPDHMTYTHTDLTLSLSWVMRQESRSKKKLMSFCRNRGVMMSTSHVTGDES